MYEEATHCSDKGEKGIFWQTSKRIFTDCDVMLSDIWCSWKATSTNGMSWERKVKYGSRNIGNSAMRPIGTFVNQKISKFSGHVYQGYNLLENIELEHVKIIGKESLAKHAKKRLRSFAQEILYFYMCEDNWRLNKL